MIKKFMFLLFFIISMSFSNTCYFENGVFDCIKNISNNQTKHNFVYPYKDLFFIKIYNISNVSNKNIPSIYYVKKENNYTVISINWKKLFFWIFIILILFAIQFIVVRLFYLKFKGDKEKLMLFFTFFNVFLFLFYLGIFLVFLNFPGIIYFSFSLYKLSYFIKFGSEIIYFILLIITILLISFIITLINYIAIDVEDAVRKAILFVLTMNVPFIIFYFIIIGLLKLFEYAKMINLLYPILIIFIYLFGAEFYNRFIVLFRSFILKKKIFEIPNSEEIKKFFSKYCKINSIKVIESPVANAFAVGLFKKDIFITSKLYNSLDNKELLSVIAHEVGHHYYNHLWKILIILVTIVLVINLLPVSEDIKSVLTILFILFVTFGLGKIQNNFEHEADLFAAKVVGKEPTINALEKIHSLNDIPKNTGKLFNIIFKHPSLEERIKYIEKNLQK